MNISYKMEQRCYKWLGILVSIFLPIFLLLLIFYQKNIWPVGDNSLLVWDMEIQYINIYNWFHDVLHGQADLLYDFSKSLGGNVYGIYAGYLASPVNLLTYFFKPEKMIYFITVSTVLKICLSGMFCYLYLKERFVIISFMSVIFSTSFALMEYNVGLCSNLHFLDSIYMLPLVALGTYKYVKEKKKVLLCLSVGYAIFCNWYISYMVCAFAVFYYIFEAVILNSKCGIKKNIRKFFLYIINLILGVIIGSVTFLPSILSTLNGKGEISYQYLVPDFHCSIIEPLKAFLISSQANTSYEEPAIYVGGLALVILLVGVFDKRIGKRKKIAVFVFLAFVFLSFSFVPLEVIWTCMKKTYSFHFRYSFVFSFLVILAAAIFWQECASNDKKFSKWVPGVVCSVTVLLALCFAVRNGWQFNEKSVYLILILLYELLLFGRYYAQQKKLRYILGGLLSVILLCELVFNGVLAFSKYNISCAEYTQYVEQTGNEIDMILDSDKEFYRLEKTFSEMDARRGTARPVATEALTFNYNPITHYSSFIDKNVSDFLTYTGYCKLNANSSNYVGFNPVMDSLLGIKYILSDKEYALLEQKDTFSCNVNQDIRIYKNPYAISFATRINGNDDNFEWSIDPFENQIHILEAMNGTVSNILQKESYQEIAPGIWEIKVSQAGPVFAYLTGGHDEKEIYVNGNYMETYFGRFYVNIMYLGEYKKGDTILLEMKDDSNCQREHNLCCYRIDQKAYINELMALQKRSINPDIMDDSYISLTWECKEAERVLLSVPYDQGWTIYQNGKECSYREVYNGLIAIDVMPGITHVEMKYVPPFLKIGAIMTVFGIICLAACEIYQRKNKLWIKGKGKND